MDEESKEYQYRSFLIKFLDLHNVKLPGKKLENIFCIDTQNVLCIFEQLYAKQKGWC